MQVSRGIETAIEEGIEEVSSQLLKPVFQDVENTDMNAIQHATQPMIQSTY